jgi:hypothetical protein
MLTITAVIRVGTGAEQAMRSALLVVAENATANEPRRTCLFVSRDAADPCVFTTYERFVDQAAMGPA